MCFYKFLAESKENKEAKHIFLLFVGEDHVKNLREGIHLKTRRNGQVKERHYNTTEGKRKTRRNGQVKERHYKTPRENGKPAAMAK